MLIRKCKKCGTENPASAIACSKCCELLLQETLLELPDQSLPPQARKSDPFFANGDRAKSDRVSPPAQPVRPAQPAQPAPYDPAFEPYRCPQCGAMIRQANMRFCNACGASLQSSPPAGAGPKPAQNPPPYQPPPYQPPPPPPAYPAPYPPGGTYLQGVTCYVPGCMNPVSIQCRGYPGYCGRMICAAHSRNGLCPDCAAREAAAHRQNQLAQTFDTTLADVRRRASSGARGKPFWWTFGSSLGVGGLGFALANSSPEAGLIFLLLAGLVFTGSIVVFLSARTRLELQFAGDADRQLPGFLGYYQQWLAAKHQEEKQNALKVLAFTGKVVGVFLLAILIGVFSGSRDDHKS